MAGVMEVMARLSGNSTGMVTAFAEGSRAASTFGKTATDVNASVAASHAATAESIKKSMMIGALAIGAVSVIAVDMAAKFQKSTELLQTAGGLTQTELEKARVGILNIAQSTGVATDQLSAGMYIVSKTTKDASEGLIILKAAAQGAVAEGVDMGTMTTALTSIMQSYNLGSDKAVSTTNALVTAAGASKTTMAEFAGSLATVLPKAAAAGLGFDQVAGAIATMTQHGTSAQQATQDLANTIVNLQAPNNVAVQMMNQLGISSTDVATNLGSRGLTGTIDFLSEAVAKHTQGGMVMLGLMKESKVAAQDAGDMLGHMTGSLKSNAQGLLDGTVSVKDYTKFIKGLDAAGYSQGLQFENLVKKTQGFSDAVKTGNPDAITFTQTMEKMLGGTTGLQSALMLGGQYMGGFQARVAEVGAAMNTSGDDIQTNAETQATLAAQTARLKAQFEAVMITIGTGLIPMFSGLVSGISDVVTWFQQNQDVASTMGNILGDVAIAIGIATVAMWIFNAALWANPVGLTVLALVGLVEGFKYAYDHIGWFKDNVNTSFGLMQGFFKELVESWKTSTGKISQFFTDVTKNLTDFQESAKRWVEDVKKNLDTFQKNAEKFTTETKGMFDDFNTNTKGMFDDFGKNTDTWNKQTQGMFDDFFKHVGEGWAGFWKDPIGETETFFTKTTDGFTGWNKDTSKTITTWIDSTKDGFKGWRKDTNKDLNDWVESTKEGFKGWNQDVSKNLTDWITGTSGDMKRWNESNSKTITDGNDGTKKDFAQWNKDTSANLTGWATNQDGGFREWNRGVSGMVKDFASNTGGMINDWGNNTNGMFNDWHNNLTGKTRTTVDDMAGSLQRFNTNTIGMFTDFNNNTKGMFADMFKHVGDGWAALQNAAAGPVRFIVNTVYNDGIRKAWNAVNDGLNLGMALPEAHFATGGVVGRAPQKFATGGIMPGYSPGVDNHIIAVGGGEAIMRPEWTRAVGASKIHAMNAMAAQGNSSGVQSMMGFASGGIVGDIMSGIGNFFANPLGSLNDMLIKPFTAMLGSTGGGHWGKMINQFPSHVMGALGNKIGGLFSAAHPAGDSGGGGGGIGGTSQWSGLVSQALGMLGQPASLLATTLRRMNQESGGNAGAINNWDSNAAAGIPSKGLMQVIDPTFRSYAMPGYNTNIYDPLSNILASMRYAIGRYGSLAGAYNQAGGYATGGIVPTFDSGGILAPGLNLVNNATGANEHLSNTTHTAGMTLVLDIPELGGRLEAKIKSVSRGTVGDAFGALTAAANSGRGTAQGVYVS